MEGAVLGFEAPVTVRNCQIGRRVKLNGGFFDNSTFLDNASMGSGAQIRDGCLLEEGARGAHNVGLKQTILFPFVTLGSLINFCDCFMAGGTDEKNHSEVGSSYIHFNYTPNQDKATASLIGDVARGVMLNQPPIFLGGQGGMVGPVMVEYGTVVAAGTIVRKDLLKPDSMLLGHQMIARSMPFKAGLYSNISRIIKLNTIYIANLIALRRWYLDVRSLFSRGDNMMTALHEGALEKLDMAFKERIKRLGDVAGKMPESIELLQGKDLSGNVIEKKKEFMNKWDDMERTFKDALEYEGDSANRDKFLDSVNEGIRLKGSGYIEAIKGLGEGGSAAGVLWMQGIVDEVCRKTWSLLPSVDIK
jgi:UDP-N-acetylglucosamine/UDP-N-acetylgalactosamine diphosphorylase